MKIYTLSLLLVVSCFVSGGTGCKLFRNGKNKSAGLAENVTVNDKKGIDIPAPNESKFGSGSNSKSRSQADPEDAKWRMRRPPIGIGISEPNLKPVYFKTDNSDLSPEAQQILLNNLKWLEHNPNIVILIEGHCDARGTVEYNLALGTRRANQVLDFIVSKGINAERIHTISYGEESPAEVGDGEQYWSRNRRVEFKKFE